MNPDTAPQPAAPLDAAAIEGLVLEAVRTANLARDPSVHLQAVSGATVFGPGSPLDSLGLVALLLDIEETFEAAGYVIRLSDERAVSQKRSPFRTVDSLVDYIGSLVQTG